MARRLVTTWYGTFLVDDGGKVLASATFPKSANAMAERLRLMREGEVLASTPSHSLVALFPRSGRQHQLRVHLAALGCPIVGDKLYGPEREAPFLEYIETGLTPELLERLGHPRQALHAHTLTFTHPDSQARFRAVAKLPEDMVALWAGLCEDGLTRLSRPSQLCDVAI